MIQFFHEEDLELVINKKSVSESIPLATEFLRTGSLIKKNYLLDNLKQ